MIPRFPIVSLLSVLLAMSTVSCGPTVAPPDVRDLNLSKEIVDHLPKDQALKFLQSLRAEGQVFKLYCRFEEDGVVRWQKEDRKFVPGKYSYTSLVAWVALPPNPPTGYESGIILYLYPTMDQLLCGIDAKANADQQGKEYKSFTAKILTALFSMGVRVHHCATPACTVIRW